ncbi:hypothetical protein JAAARDRAFT_410298 [Jaapia argillacea MUCL 33604]|uniref:Uncharacterized protein n=1 Tax=Jaapia argillacea MUCL 33604 TaxID=933084 RepID=A0A067PUQ4_9AGAM|nr:hypothetical protein JAAARDRAFT_410298 [Jaapia argillacea MUCL 33604]
MAFAVSLDVWRTVLFSISFCLHYPSSQDVYAVKVGLPIVPLWPRPPEFRRDDSLQRVTHPYNMSRFRTEAARLVLSSRTLLFHSKSPAGRVRGISVVASHTEMPAIPSIFEVVSRPHISTKKVALLSAGC